MTFQTTLIEAGFDKEAAEKLADNEYFRQNFHNSKKSSEEILERINLIAAVYDTDTDSVRDAITKFPPFASLDHERVVNGIRDVYGWSKEEVGRVVFKHPQFASLDHERVMRKLSRIGRIVGLDEGTVKEKIMKNPKLAGYSAKRYLAVIDVVMHLRTEGELRDSRAVDLCLSYHSTSPYVPGTDRLRVTQALKRGNYDADPPLMGTLRRSMRNSEEKNERRKLIA